MTAVIAAAFGLALAAGLIAIGLSAAWEVFHDHDEV